MKSVLKGFFTNPFVLFFAFWGVLNIVQAHFTPLNNDEAYYWMYSRHPAWGYFDHPPMIAMMIRLGYYFLHNELGVRIIVVLSQIAGFMIIWNLTESSHRKEQKDIYIFFLLIAVLPILNIYSFFATPDSPLLLFSAVFLLGYKKFLQNESWLNTLWLGVSMAALMYSKYHGALVIALVILSNLKLLAGKKLYLALVLALLLYLPHLSWQHANGFPSLKYHLVDRVSGGLNLVHIPEYLVGQYFFNNPFLITLVIFIVIRIKAGDLFHRALYYIFAGFFTFFLISSFRYRIEPQWLAVVSIPMVILIMDNLDFRAWIRKYILRTSIFILPMILIVRSTAAIDYWPLPILKNEFHGKKQWVSDISKLAGSRPVVFTNSYQRPSIYTFYSGKPAYTLDNLNYRKTQFDIWDSEEELHGKEILYVPHYFNDLYKTKFEKQVLSSGDTIYTQIFSDFQSFQKDCIQLADTPYIFSRTGVNTIDFKIFNRYPYSINFRHKEFPVVIQIAFFRNGYMETKKNLILPDNISILKPGEEFNSSYRFTVEDLPPGNYRFAICSETGILYDTVNSNFRMACVTD